MSNKRVVSETSVEPALTFFRCAGRSCFEVTSSRCLGCKSIVYCSRVCQETNWDDHKGICKKVEKCFAEVEKEVKHVRNYKDWDGSTKNLFEADVGRFWGLLDPRDYCRARFMLAQSLRDCAMKNNSRLALELALEHLLDLVWLTHSDNMGCRDIIPSIMVSLGRMQDAYDFIKWWSSQDCNYDWADLELPYLNMKDEDMTESLEAFHVDKYTDVGTLLSLLMIKLAIQVELKIKRDDASTKLYKVIKHQTTELIDMIKKANIHLLPLLLERSKITDSDIPDFHSRGEVNEAYHVVFNTRMAWDKFAKFITVENMNSTI